MQLDKYFFSAHSRIKSNGDLDLNIILHIQRVLPHYTCMGSAVFNAPEHIARDYIPPIDRFQMPPDRLKLCKLQDLMLEKLPFFTPKETTPVMPKLSADFEEIPSKLSDFSLPDSKRQSMGSNTTAPQASNPLNTQFWNSVPGSVQPLGQPITSSSESLGLIMESTQSQRICPGTSIDPDNIPSTIKLSSDSQSVKSSSDSHLFKSSLKSSGEQAVESGDAPIQSTIQATLAAGEFNEDVSSIMIETQRMFSVPPSSKASPRKPVPIQRGDTQPLVESDLEVDLPFRIKEPEKKVVNNVGGIPIERFAFEEYYVTDDDVDIPEDQQSALNSLISMRSHKKTQEIIMEESEGLLEWEPEEPVFTVEIKAVTRQENENAMYSNQDDFDIEMESEVDELTPDEVEPPKKVATPIRSQFEIAMESEVDELAPDSDIEAPKLGATPIHPPMFRNICSMCNGVIEGSISKHGQTYHQVSLQRNVKGRVSLAKQARDGFCHCPKCDFQTPLLDEYVGHIGEESEVDASRKRKLTQSSTPQYPVQPLSPTQHVQKKVLISPIGADLLFSGLTTPSQKERGMKQRARSVIQELMDEDEDVLSMNSPIAAMDTSRIISPTQSQLRPLASQPPSQIGRKIPCISQQSVHEDEQVVNLDTDESQEFPQKSQEIQWADTSSSAPASPSNVQSSRESSRQSLSDSSNESDGIVEDTQDEDPIQDSTPDVEIISEKKTARFVYSDSDVEVVQVKRYAPKSASPQQGTIAKTKKSIIAPRTVVLKKIEQYAVRSRGNEKPKKRENVLPMFPMQLETVETNKVKPVGANNLDIVWRLKGHRFGH